VVWKKMHASDIDETEGIKTSASEMIDNLKENHTLKKMPTCLTKLIEQLASTGSYDVQEAVAAEQPKKKAKKGGKK
jgi:hypothetical protein